MNHRNGTIPQHSRTLLYPLFASHSDDVQFETCGIIQGHVMHLLWDYCRKLRKYPLKTGRSTGHGQEEVMSQDMTEANGSKQLVSLALNQLTETPI